MQNSTGATSGEHGLRVVLIGPPGSGNSPSLSCLFAVHVITKLIGKGTQSLYIKNKYRICHLATGDMLRAQVAQKTALGKAAKEIMDAGGLVSDEIMIKLIEKEIIENPDCQNG